MGGKGRKRREKNYRKAHGGNVKLPPPPDPCQLEALPSSLRKIMAFTSASSRTSASAQPGDPGSFKASKDDTEERRKRMEAAVGGSKLHFEAKIKDGGTAGQRPILHRADSDGETVQNSKHEKRKRKRKRKQVEDLRFEADKEILGGASKRKERRKKLLETRKKKHKRKKTEDNIDFPGREQIKFGEVVEAPPKLVTVPKAPKVVHDASRERLRLQAIEAYRHRKGWESRPGIKLQLPTATVAL